MYRFVLLLLFVAAPGLACSSHSAAPGSWPTANGSSASTRATSETDLDAATIPKLQVRWRFRLPKRANAFGATTANPVLVGDTVYVQDSSSSVFALDAKTGERLWQRRLVNVQEQFVAIPPVADRGRVYYATQGFPPGGRGKVYALSARTGRVLWRFDTIAAPWRHIDAGGGGAWYPVSVDGRGDVYVGTANPAPWGGFPEFPNGALFPGAARWTDSLVVLDGATGKLRWADQVTAHDVRDYDFQASPVLVGNRVFGAGKAGRVVAWDRTTHRRVWTRAVGTHRHDLGPLPSREVLVCPGHLGGVETPMAYAHGLLFVPVVELCSRESAVTSENAFARDPAEGRGVVYALDAKTGRTVWRRPLAAPPFGCATVANDAVVVPSYDGRLSVFAARDGRLVWRTRLPNGNNSCPAVGRDVLVVGAGAPYPGIRHRSSEVVAYEIGG